MNNVYQAALPNNVVAVIQAKGSQLATMFIFWCESQRESHFTVKTVYFKYDSWHGNHKTIENAIKHAVDMLIPKKCEFDFYINPTLIHLLPKEWANAETSQLVRFELGKKYIDSKGETHTVTSIMSTGMDYDTTDAPMVELLDSKNNTKYGYIRYSNGVEICEINHSIQGSPTLSADNPQ